MDSMKTLHKALGLMDFVIHYSDLCFSRNLRMPSGEPVRLLFDVIHCNKRIIEPAVLFAVSNCLVCETTDTARHVAYELDPRVKYNVCKSIKL
jgi:Chromosome segregation ATPases